MSAINFWMISILMEKNYPEMGCSSKVIMASWYNGESFQPIVGSLLCRVSDTIPQMPITFWRMGHNRLVGTFDAEGGSGDTSDCGPEVRSCYPAHHTHTWYLPSWRCTETCSHVSPYIYNYIIWYNYITWYYGIWYDIIWYYILLYVMILYIISYHIASYRIVSYHIIYHMIRYDTMRLNTTQYNTK